MTPPDDVLSLEDSWGYYEGLLQDQKQVLVSNADEEAFKYGLAHFPALKRVTITPAAHGLLRKPLYETPMIRGFPLGFGYPIPRGWPDFERRQAAIEALLCEANDADQEPYHQMYGMECTPEDYRKKWRGFRSITRLLAENKEHQVSEFVVDVHRIETGVNCHIFDQPCPEYRNPAALLKRPGFRRLDLALFTGFLEQEEWVSYKSGILYSALAAAKDLEHISLWTSIDIDSCGYPGQLHLNDRDPEDYSLPLRTISPIADWPRLRHFGLSKFLVQQSDLIASLAALPPTLR